MKTYHKQPNLFFKACLSFGMLLSMATYGQGAETSSAEMSKAVAAKAFGSLEWVPCPDPLNFEGCHITILHGDPTKANSDVLFRMQPGTTAPAWYLSRENSTSPIRMRINRS